MRLFGGKSWSGGSHVLLGVTAKISLQSALLAYCMHMDQGWTQKVELEGPSQGEAGARW